jgi:hypothetical protein
MALHVASSKGHTATVKMLIEAGANVHCKSDKGSGQYTALHAASAEGHTATVKELLAAGADVHGMIYLTNNAFGTKHSIFTPGFGERFVAAAVGYGRDCIARQLRMPSCLSDCAQKGLCCSSIVAVQRDSTAPSIVEGPHGDREGAGRGGCGRALPEQQRVRPRPVLRRLSVAS